MLQVNYPAFDTNCVRSSGHGLVKDCAKTAVECSQLYDFLPFVNRTTMIDGRPIAAGPERLFLETLVIGNRTIRTERVQHGCTGNS